jgi:hypothetical protein
MKLQKLSNISGALVLLIALAAFTLSFDAIYELSVQNGTDRRLAWIVPIIVDGAMVVFSIAALRATLQGERARNSWILIGVFTALSVTLNVAHAMQTPIGILIAVFVPIALFASFETLMSQVRATMQKGVNALAMKWQRRAKWLLAEAKRQRERAKRLQAQLRDTQTAVASLQEEKAAMQSRLDRLQIEANESKALRKRIAILEASAQSGEVVPVGVGGYGRDLLRLFADDGLTLQEVADKHGVNVSTVSRDKAKLNGGGK